MSSSIIYCKLCFIESKVYHTQPRINPCLAVPFSRNLEILCTILTFMHLNNSKCAIPYCTAQPKPNLGRPILSNKKQTTTTTRHKIIIVEKEYSVILTL